MRVEAFTEITNIAALRIWNIPAEYVNVAVEKGDKTCTFKALNRSPSQTQDDFFTVFRVFKIKLGIICNYYWFQYIT